MRRSSPSPSPSPLALALALAVSCLATFCVPADHALRLGSIEFEVRASRVTTSGVPEIGVVDGWALRFDRALLAFKTVTIGQIGDPNKCSYRGRGAVGDVVFDARYGNVQIFNGLEATDCSDVGFVLASPGGGTSPGLGATGADLVMMAEGDPALAYVEVTATRPTFAPDAPVGAVDTYRVVLRFDEATTPSRFGACHGATKGVKVLANQRVKASIALSADAFFRESIDANAALRFSPFADADANGDHVITMAELDAFPLERARIYSESYHLQSGATSGPFGTFVRALMKFAFFFGDDGTCVGDDPGTPPPP